MAGLPLRPVALIVEDDDAIARTLTRMLALEGWSAVHAQTNAEAIALINEHAISAVILDLLLARGDNGVEFLKWLRSSPQHALTPACIFTGLVDITPQDRHHIAQSGARLFPKPTGLASVLDYVKSAAPLGELTGR
jgi:DNA-binding response OmpR family regulator